MKFGGADVVSSNFGDAYSRTKIGGTFDESGIQMRNNEKEQKPHETPGFNVPGDGKSIF